MIIEITDQEWAAFQRHRDYRDECCMKLGVLLYESELLKRRYYAQIEQSVREEQQQANEIARAHGIDPDRDFTITDGAIRLNGAIQ
ncbi:MAG: hypothetical protein L0220_26280 [Acidobacteria bacterium]|nr:hypothetical protein [Acidobacteriota bacterium]